MEVEEQIKSGDYSISDLEKLIRTCEAKKFELEKAEKITQAELHLQFLKNDSFEDSKLREREDEFDYTHR